MALRNIIILTNTEAQMQGLIRAIEELDENHDIGIIHGSYGKDAVDEVTLVLAELANARILKQSNIKMNAHPRGIGIPYMDMELNDYQTIDEAKNDILKTYNNKNKQLIDELLK